MKTKIFSLLLALIASAGTLWASNTEVDGIWYDFNSNTKEASVTYRGSEYNSYTNEYSGDVTIPPAVTYNNITYKVTRIGELAFEGCTGLTSITIPNSVTGIGYGAFYGCTGLTSITIPNSVTSIGEGAFVYCTDLTSITIPNSVTSIGIRTFDNCTGLTSITIPNSVTNIGMDAFSGCTGLTSITIPNSVTSIGDGAFSGCTGLMSITIPNSVTSIDDNAFSGCKGLTSITIPNSVTGIGDFAFSGCKGLTSITLPNSVTSIGRAFEGCTGLTAIYVPCGELGRFKTMLSRYYDRVKYMPSASYTITKNAEYGSISTTSTQFTICDDEHLVTCTAIPNYGYHFVRWADGNTDNPRTIELTQDTTLMAEFTKNTYSVVVQSSSYERGIVSDNISALYLDIVEISATPNYGYHFDHWNDGNTSNPRTITITENKTYTATFAKNIYAIAKITNSEHGTIIGNSQAEYLDVVTLDATPNNGYYFVCWADGNTDNPRTIKITQDTTMEAIFDYLLDGKCGKDNALTWKLNLSSMALDVTGKGSLSENYTYGTFIESLTIGNEVTVIGQNAFKNHGNLKHVVIGSSVKVLEQGAFYNCSGIQTITCYSQRPPTVNADALYGLDYSTIVYVPKDYLDNYVMHDIWGLYDVRPLEAETVQTNDIKVTPSENTADVVWPQTANAATYELVIKDKNGNVICTLVFNANGQLTQIAFAAPSRINAPAQAQAAGFAFTVTGLESGTTYDLTLTAKNGSGATLNSRTVSFSTQGPTALEDIADDAASASGTQKVMIDGQIYILRDGKAYTVTGAEVK